MTSADRPNFGNSPVSSGLYLPSDEQQREALAGIERLKDPYPGRGVLMGVNDRGEIIQALFVMGRRVSTRNRILVRLDNGDVETEDFDKSQVNPEAATTLYKAMTQVNGTHIVTNGDHTDRIAEAFARGTSLTEALKGESFEPDPSHTPRIVTYSSSGPSLVTGGFGIVRPMESDFDSPSPITFDSPVSLGIGRIIQTYVGDGTTDAFRDGPYAIPLKGDLVDIGNTIWAALNEEFRVALAVKSIDLETGDFKVGIINRHTPEAPITAV